MNNCQVIVGQTTEGYLELVAVEYEQVGKVFRPTKKADEFLKKYRFWKDVTLAVKYNLDLQDDLRYVFGWAL